MSNRIYVSNPDDKVQSYNPSYQVIIFPYTNHDTQNINPNDYKGVVGTNPPLYIVSDVIQMTVSKTKNAPEGRLAMTLVGGDINYQEAVYPGDWIMAYMSRSEIIDNPSIDINSGLKFLGMVTEVYRDENTTGNGATVVRYTITAAEWSHVFNSNIYFSPATLLDAQKQQELTGFAYTLAGVFKAKGDILQNVEPNQLVDTIITSILGANPLNNTIQLTDTRTVASSPQRSFLIPDAVSKIFRFKADQITKNNEKHPSSIVNIMQRWLGLQKYAKNSLIPSSFEALKGAKIFAVDLGSCVTVWSLLELYSHKILNEKYCELLPDRDNPTILRPTFALRQIPFTTNEFKFSSNDSKTDFNLTTTKFDELPRVVVPKEFLINKHIGKSIAPIMNYLQLFGQASSDTQGAQAIQTELGNEANDTVAVYRYGLKPMIQTSDFDNPGLGDGVNYRSPAWIRLLKDWWLKLHHHFNGSITTFGIQEHLAVGYNLQIEDKLYHIEGYTHTFQVYPTGSKEFRTRIDISMGRTLDKNGNSSIKVKTGKQGDPTIDAQNASILDRDDRGIVDVEDRPRHDDSSRNDGG